MARWLLVSGVAVLCATLSFGVDYFTIKTGTTDWTDPMNYEEGIAPEKGKGHIVRIPKGATVYLDDSEKHSASWDLAASLGRIVPMSTNSCIEITVEGDRELTVPISFYQYSGSNFDYNHGPVVKKGAGILSLNSQKVMPNSSTTGDCYAHYSVEEGTLKLQQKNTVGKALLGVLEVAEGAELCLPTGPALGIVTNSIMGLQGKGVVRACASSVTRVSFNGRRSRENPVCVFEGDLLGVAQVEFLADCQGLTGVRNDFPSFVVPANSAAVIGFGSTMGASTDDVGCLGTFASNQFGSYVNKDMQTTFLYLGETQSDVFRNFYVSPTGKGGKSVLTFDGGAYGGVSLGKDVAAASGMGQIERVYSTKYSAVVCLTGNHANECMLVGNINDNWNSSAAGCSGHTIRFVKEGTGVWRFTDTHKNNKARRNFADVIDVREGTLRFDSIDNVGLRCALGLSVFRTDGAELFGNVDSMPVGYAYLMGAPKFDGTQSDTAMLEYSSTSEAGRCSTRPIALAGHGGLANNGVKNIKFATVYGLSDRDMSFTLAGSNAGNNEIADISDGTGDGKVSVFKNGSGTWLLSGEQTFSGDLVVTGGTLIVRKPSSKRFTWFRFTAKGLYNRIGKDVNEEKTPFMRLHEFGLFDEKGMRLNVGLGTPSDSQFVKDGNTAHNYLESTDWVNVKPGEAAVETRGRLRYMYGATLSRIFDGVSDGEGLILQSIPYAGTAFLSMKDDDLNSHIAIVMRLKSDCASTVTSFDYMFDVNKSAIGASDHNTCTRLRAYSLEGSVDGLIWEKICEDRGAKDDDSDCDPVRLARKWISNDADMAAENGVDLPHKGFPLSRTESSRAFSVLENVNSVQVSHGAVLKMEAGSEPVSLSSLRIDAASGGTIDGFSFADAEGAVDVMNSPDVHDAELPITFVNCRNLANLAKWSVSLEGKAKPDYCLSVSGNRVTLCRMGLRVIVR